VGQVTIDEQKRKISALEKWCSDRASSRGMKGRKMMKFEYEKIGKALFLGSHSRSCKRKL
jgi:hypothetical protein